MNAALEDRSGHLEMAPVVPVAARETPAGIVRCPDTRIVEALVWPRNLLGAAGIFLGFWFLSSAGAGTAVKWVCLLAVGGVGIVAFLSHVVFARADAQRLGFGDKPSGFQYESGKRFVKNVVTQNT
jgi:hypothetical protein